MKDQLAAVDGAGGARPRSGGGAVAQDSPLEPIERALAELTRLFTSQRVHEQRMSGSGVHISRTGLRCLTLVDRLGPVSVTKLASIMDLSQATASRAIASLEADRLLARAGDPGDGRVTYCTTTVAGRRALQRIQRFMYGQLEDALAGMPSDRQRDLASTLTELVELLQTVPGRSAQQDPGRGIASASHIWGAPGPATSPASSPPAASSRNARPVERRAHRDSHV